MPKTKTMSKIINMARQAKDKAEEGSIMRKGKKGAAGGDYLLDKVKVEERQEED